MPNDIIRNFSTWIVQDDIALGFLDAKNIDGNKESYWMKLWPKVNKVFTTDWVPMRGITGEQKTSWLINESLIGGDSGKLYKLDSTDDTPAFTLAGWWDILAVHYSNNYFYIFYQNGSDLDVAKVSAWRVQDGTFSDMNETFITNKMNRSAWAGCPAILSVGANQIYVGAEFGSVSSIILSSGSVQNRDFIDWYAVGITAQGSVYMLYSSSWMVYMWDGAANLTAGQNYLGSRIAKVASKLGTDFITTEDGQLYVGQWLGFQRITRPRKSNRLEDNASYSSVLDFSIDESENRQNHTIYPVNDDIYIYTSDGVKGLYKYGSILPNTPSWFHKVICQNHAGVDIDFIYDMFYYERTLKRLYFSYKAGTTYWVDSIDVESLETVTDWYLVTNVFSANTSYNKVIDYIRNTISNTSSDNFIKLYIRTNNGAWELLRTFNEVSDTILTGRPIKANSNNAFKRYVDRQYKIEMHNGNAGNNTPTFHELDEYYDLDNKNG